MDKFLVDITFFVKSSFSSANPNFVEVLFRFTKRNFAIAGIHHRGTEGTKGKGVRGSGFGVRNRNSPQWHRGHEGGMGFGLVLIVVVLLLGVIVRGSRFAVPRSRYGVGGYKRAHPRPAPIKSVL